VSLARINISTFAARKGKTLACEGCHKPINKGERYKWFKVGFRSRFVHAYHMGCTIKDSARESSLMVGVYSGIETAEDTIGAIGWAGDPGAVVQEIKDALEAAADEWRGVSEEYGSAADNSPTGMVFGVDYREVADSIEAAADTLADWEPGESEPDVEHGDHADEGDERTGIVDDCDECEANVGQWLESIRDEAIESMGDAQGEIEVP
jgi:hypothetical protein